VAQLIRIEQRAVPGTRFAAAAFARRIGKTVPISLAGHRIAGDCTLAGARVSDNGTAVTLMVRASESAVLSMLTALGRTAPD
jgi:hypothetical protein